MTSGRQTAEDLEERLRELEQENSILKIKNKDELNTKLLILESKLEDS